MLVGFVFERRQWARAAQPALIINGDDFGLSEENNAGIIKAHRAGILSSTSLMVGGPACERAVKLVKSHRRLAVGLHLSFSDVRPVLPPEKVDRLVQRDGCFPPEERAVYSALWSAQGRQQIRAEIAAQFDAFHRLDIPCDHVNVHRNAHVHPLLAVLVFQAAAQWRVKMVRIPWNHETIPLWRRFASFLRAVFLREMAKVYGLQAPRRSIGRVWNVPRLIHALSAEGRVSTEYFFHPIEMKNHVFADDLPALLDASVKQAARRWRLCGYQSAMIPTGVDEHP